MDLNGPGSALVTLRTGAGDVDAVAMEQQALLSAAAGVTMLLVAGSTGEGHACSTGDRMRLVEACARSGVPVIAGLGDHSRSRTVRQLRSCGASAVLASPAAILPLMDSGADGELPIIAYHHPHLGLHFRTSEMGPEVMPRLYGVKDSSGDARSVSTFVEAGLRVYVGGTPTLTQARRLGASGLISGLGSAMPEVICRSWGGDEEAQQLLERFERDHPARVMALKTALQGRLKAGGTITSP